MQNLFSLIASSLLLLGVAGGFASFTLKLEHLRRPAILVFAFGFALAVLVVLLGQ